jgi:hypothetical protein
MSGRSRKCCTPSPGRFAVSPVTWTSPCCGLPRRPAHLHHRVTPAGKVVAEITAAGGTAIAAAAIAAAADVSGK